MLNWEDVTDVEVDGIELEDYPDMSNSTAAAAWNLKAGRPCTEEELDYINQEFAGEIQELARERAW